MFTFCISRDLIENNPFIGIEEEEEEEAVDRYLLFEEIRTFWSTVSGENSPITRRLSLGLMLLLITGVRSQELRLARMEHFDLEQKLWTIPPAAVKTVKAKRKRANVKRRSRARVKREYVVPPSDLAVEIVQELMRIAREQGHSESRLFPNNNWRKRPDAPMNEKAFYHALEDHVDKSGPEPTLFSAIAVSGGPLGGPMIADWLVPVGADNFQLA